MFFHTIMNGFDLDHWWFLVEIRLQRDRNLAIVCATELLQLLPDGREHLIHCCGLRWVVIEGYQGLLLSVIGGSVGVIFRLQDVVMSCIAVILVPFSSRSR